MHACSAWTEAQCRGIDALASTHAAASCSLLAPAQHTSPEQVCRGLCFGMRGRGSAGGGHPSDAGGRDSEPAVTGGLMRKRCSEGIGEGREQYAPRAPCALLIRASMCLCKPPSTCTLGV
jgi:hypothetical protein